MTDESVSRPGTAESPARSRLARIDRAIALAGVEHLRDREMSTLSGGRRQLVRIAMVVAQATDVLLLDEPTTFLDLQHQMQVVEIVERLRDESSLTVVLVLHDADQAARYADRMIALDDGAVYDRGPPETVVTEDLLADVSGIEATVTATEHGPQVTPLRSLDGREAETATTNTGTSDDTGERPDESSEPESTTTPDGSLA
jgi:iron complex transport system ATP-binding protein